MKCEVWSGKSGVITSYCSLFTLVPRPSLACHLVSPSPSHLNHIQYTHTLYDIFPEVIACRHPAQQPVWLCWRPKSSLGTDLDQENAGEQPWVPDEHNCIFVHPGDTRRKITASNFTWQTKQFSSDRRFTFQNIYSNTTYAWHVLRPKCISRNGQFRLDSCTPSPMCRMTAFAREIRRLNTLTMHVICGEIEQVDMLDAPHSLCSKVDWNEFDFRGNAKLERLYY